MHLVPVKIILSHLVFGTIIEPNTWTRRNDDFSEAKSSKTRNLNMQR